MFINPINKINIEQNKNIFRGYKKPNIERNNMKILLSQDIWAPKLKVKMPESILEKEVILEILKKRLKLDRFTQLSNEKFSAKGQLSIYKDLFAANPNSKECRLLGKEILKKGNLNTYFQSLNHQINVEKRENYEEIMYFNNIRQLEDTYLGKELISEEKMDEFYSQIVEKNINKDGRLSTAELIKIIESSSIPKEKNEVGAKEVALTAATTATVANVTQPEKVTKIYSKKQLLTNIEVEYEKRLKEEFNIYKRPFNHDKEIALVRGDLERKYIESIIKYPEIGKALIKTYETIEKRFKFKINQIAHVNIFALDIGFDRLGKIETAIAELSAGVKTLKIELAKNPNNQKLKDDIKLKEDTIKDLKFNYGKWLEHNVEHEQINHQRMIEAGKEAEYLYLTGENKLIKKYAEAYKIFKENNDSIPESYWG